MPMNLTADEFWFEQLPGDQSRLINHHEIPGEETVLEVDTMAIRMENAKKRSRNPSMETRKKEGHMNKTELIKALAEETTLSQKQAASAIDATVGIIATKLSEGEAVTLPGFGTFSVVDRAARKGRNPKTGEEIEIAASKTPKFKAGKQLRESVN